MESQVHSYPYTNRPIPYNRFTRPSTTSTTSTTTSAPSSTSSQSNITSITDYLPQAPSTNANPLAPCFTATYVHHKGVKQEVYPFKASADIQAMQLYFLNNSLTPSTTKRAQALRNWLFFIFGINIGYRGGDVCTLKWSDVINPDYSVRKDLYNYKLEQKTSKHRLLIFNSDIEKAVSFYFDAISRMYPLTSYIHLDDYIFPSQTSIHLTPKGYIKMLKDAAHACGITYNVGTHSLRKTFGYRYYTATNDIITLQQIFGHSSSLITLLYIGITAETIQAAHEKIVGNIPENMERFL